MDLQVGGTYIDHQMVPHAHSQNQIKDQIDLPKDAARWTAVKWDPGLMDQSPGGGWRGQS